MFRENPCKFPMDYHHPALYDHLLVIRPQVPIVGQKPGPNCTPGHSCLMVLPPDMVILGV